MFRSTVRTCLFGLILLNPLLLRAQDSEFFVYNIYRGLSLGNSNEAPEKDFYVNIGASQGVQRGSVLEVLRHVPTHELLSEQFYQDVTYPIARLKVIHAEAHASIARMDRLLPLENTPSISPRAVMVGDWVRLAEVEPIQETPVAQLPTPVQPPSTAQLPGTVTPPTLTSAIATPPIVPSVANSPANATNASAKLSANTPVNSTITSAANPQANSLTVR